MTSQSNETAAFWAGLQRVFRFSEADLRANRQGILSAAQQQRLQEEHEDDARLLHGGLVAVTIIGYLGSGAAAIQAGLSLGEMWRGVTVSLLVISLFAWILLHVNGAKMRRTLHVGAGAEVNGSIRLAVEGGRLRTHYLCVGPQCFEITAHDYFRLTQLPIDGRQATLYYSRPWRHVLSVAPV